MSKFWLAIGGAFFVTIAFCVGLINYAAQLKPIEPPPIELPLNPAVIFNSVNIEREKAGVKPLVRDSRLDATAQAKADDMVAKNYFAHYNPQTNEFAGSVHIMFPGLCSFASENIVWVNYHPPFKNYNKMAMDSWRRSKPHYDAMLDPRYTTTGIGIKEYKVVQHFCIEK